MAVDTKRTQTILASGWRSPWLGREWRWWAPCWGGCPLRHRRARCSAGLPAPWGALSGTHGRLGLDTHGQRFWGRAHCALGRLRPAPRQHLWKMHVSRKQRELGHISYSLPSQSVTDHSPDADWHSTVTKRLKRVLGSARGPLENSTKVAPTSPNQITHAQPLLPPSLTSVWTLKVFSFVPPYAQPWAARPHMSLSSWSIFNKHT